jgi:hypothetical protein
MEVLEQSDLRIAEDYRHPVTGEKLGYNAAALRLRTHNLKGLEDRALDGLVMKVGRGCTMWEWEWGTEVMLSKRWMNFVIAIEEGGLMIVREGDVALIVLDSLIIEED